MSECQEKWQHLPLWNGSQASVRRMRPGRRLSASELYCRMLLFTLVRGQLGNVGSSSMRPNTNETDTYLQKPDNQGEHDETSA